MCVFQIRALEGVDLSLQVRQCFLKSTSQVSVVNYLGLLNVRYFDLLLSLLSA